MQQNQNQSRNQNQNQNQNQPPQPPNQLAPPRYQHVGPEETRQPPTPGFQSSVEVEAFMNQAAAQSRYYDLEPLPGEFGPWRRPNPGAPPGSATITSWDSQNQLPLVNPYTMQSNTPNNNAPNSYAPRPAYDGHGYYASSSTESTPPNGFVPYYIDSNHANLTQLQSSHHASTPISPYSAVLSPNADPNSLSDPEAEQKRLRNTAASARFRAKKKKREASLERASNERRTLVNVLEGRVKELEEENKWLKDLVWEKRDVREEKELSRLRKGDAGSSSVDGEGQGKKEGDRNDGVGTD